MEAGGAGCLWSAAHSPFIPKETQEPETLSLCAYVCACVCTCVRVHVSACACETPVCSKLIQAMRTESQLPIERHVFYSAATRSYDSILPGTETTGLMCVSSYDGLVVDLVGSWEECPKPHRGSSKLKITAASRERELYHGTWVRREESWFHRL